MLSTDLDDTHLCIRCSSTIVGLDNYIEHRKSNCKNLQTSHCQQQKVPATVNPNNSSIIVADDNELSSHTSRTHLDHTYDAFSYHEPEAPTTYVNKNQHGGKTSKSLTDVYELPYELGADVFFSSLQLQSVQSTGPSTSGKTGSNSGSGVATQNASLQRQKSFHAQHADGGKISGGWMSHHTFVEISKEEQNYENIFKPISFAHGTPELTDDDDEDVEEEDINDDDDEEFVSIAHGSSGSGGKWKSSPLLRHSPPVVPASHTGGKWRPGNRPQLVRVSHTQISRISPNWDEHGDECEIPAATLETQQPAQHPPEEHTKGKWIPGTKLQRLEYKEVLAVKKSAIKEEYWCNICCRRLKNKLNYESHLRTTYHRKRAEPEQQLEKATLSQLKHEDISKIFETQQITKAEDLMTTAEKTSKKRKRRAALIKCDVCKHSMPRHLIGKHLISHYHYRRMHVGLGKSLRMVIDNIHSIVMQSPFQCRPCNFYANTEENFLLHWNSAQHLDASEGAGKFYCSYCQYECEDNNQMRRHLVSAEHKEVILAINRSVPICISKRISLCCGKCRQSFRYNAELRRHMRLMHAGEEITGTASDVYQSRYKCNICGECCRSQVTLQRHEKYKHGVYKFFCSICKLQFGTPCQARRHRKRAAHRRQAALAYRTSTKQKVVFNQKNCSQCDFVAKSDVEAMLHELTHSSNKSNNPTTPRIRTPKSTLPKRIKKRKRKLTKEELTNQFLKCKNCEKLFKTKTELKEHCNLEHSTMFTHICGCCGESFLTAQALGRHTRNCKPINRPNLELNKTTIGNEEIVELEKNWQCDKCTFSSIYESELIFHRLHHEYGQLKKNEPLRCPLCPKSFRKSSLRCHLRQHTNEKNFECEFCKLKFSRRHNLKDHIRKQHNDKQQKLQGSANNTNKSNNDSETKNKTFVSSNKTKENPKEQSEPHQQKYLCDICNKQFANKYTLKMHKESKHHNSTQRKFACTFEGCLYAAISQAVLRFHLTTTHGGESLQCDHPNCSYIGKSAVHLLRHRTFHDAPKKIFECNECNFKTRLKSHITRHMLTHGEKKLQKCPYCDFKSKTLENLRSHILKTNKHPGKFVYECKFCAQEIEKQEELKESDAEKIVIFKTNSYQEMLRHKIAVHNIT